MERFAVLSSGGVLVGLAVEMLWVAIALRLADELLVIVLAALVSWISHLAGEAVGVSGVIATVTAGLVLGWHQREIFSAGARLKGSSFWQVLIFLFEASVFMLIDFFRVRRWALSSAGWA